MYRIDEKSDREKYILLIPAMLDMHFPLLKYAFYSKNYRPVVLENEENIVNIGLKYVNNDMCYPIILITGQMIAALQSGKSAAQHPDHPSSFCCVYIGFFPLLFVRSAPVLAIQTHTL